MRELQQNDSHYIINKPIVRVFYEFASLREIGVIFTGSERGFTKFYDAALLWDPPFINPRSATDQHVCALIFLCTNIIIVSTQMCG